MNNVKEKITAIIILYLVAGMAVAQTFPKQLNPFYTKPYVNPQNPIVINNPIQIKEHSEATILNRRYYIDILAPVIAPVGEESLQITGNGLLVGFRNTSGNLFPYVLGNTIFFGGHEFEILPIENEYRFDNEFYTLTKNIFYSFVDGELISVGS